jgi:hypothetical protein
MRSTALLAVLLLAPCLAAGQVGTDTPIGRVAVFPIEHDRIPRDVGVILAERVAGYIGDRTAGVGVLGPVGVTTRLDAAGLRDAWDRFVFTLTMTGIPDPVELARVCDGLDVDALLQLEVATWIQRGASVGRGYQIVPALRVGLRAWLFDCVPPRLQGERWSEGRSVGAVSRQKGLTEITAASAAAAVGAAVDAMLGALPPLAPDSQPTPAAVPTKTEGVDRTET